MKRTIAAVLMFVATLAPAKAFTLTICDNWPYATLTIDVPQPSKNRDRLLMVIEGDQNFVTVPVYFFGNSFCVVVINPINLSLLRQNSVNHYKIYNPVTNIVLNEGYINCQPC